MSDDRIEEAARLEWEALGLLSYTGGQADLDEGDIEQIRSVLKDTAAALREAQAEIEELRRSVLLEMENVRLARADYNTLLASHEATSETVLALQAENERLRKALNRLVAFLPSEDQEHGRWIVNAADAPADEAKHE